MRYNHTGMRKEQKFTPKYWVGHDPRENDVYIDTADKNRFKAITKFQKLLMCNDSEYEKCVEEGKAGVVLIEIKLIDP